MQIYKKKIKKRNKTPLIFNIKIFFKKFKKKLSNNFCFKNILCIFAIVEQ